MAGYEHQERRLAAVMAQLWGNSVDEAEWRNFRDSLDACLRQVPDLYVIPQLEWVGQGIRTHPGPHGRPPESMQRTKHIVKTQGELYPGALPGRDRSHFVADIHLNDFLDRGVDYYRPEAMQPHVGDAVVHTMVNAPATIRRLLARIDALEARIAQ